MTDSSSSANIKSMNTKESTQMHNIVELLKNQRQIFKNLEKQPSKEQC